MARAREELSALELAAAQETKSSAGDKYETAREMIAQARSMQASALREAEAGMEWLVRQDSSRSFPAVALGALFRTGDGWFLACPVPVRIDVDGQSVQGLSLQGPLGQAVKGARVGEAREFRGKRISVLAVD